MLDLSKNGDNEIILNRPWTVTVRLTAYDDYTADDEDEANWRILIDAERLGGEPKITKAATSATRNAENHKIIELKFDLTAAENAELTITRNTKFNAQIERRVDGEWTTNSLMKAYVAADYTPGGEQ